VFSKPDEEMDGMRKLGVSVWIAILTVVLTIGWVAQAQNLPGDVSNLYTWKPLRTGAGGWVTGVDISPDGTVVVARTDTGGAYRWDEASLNWTQLVTAQSMPDEAYRQYGGVLTIVTAPSQPQRLYMAYFGTVYRSDDLGSSWSRTGLTGLDFDANAEYRQQGERLAVDRTNSDRVYFGTPKQGLWLTTDGGANWSQVDLGISAAEILVSNIKYDVLGNVYATVDGQGVFRASAGLSWSRISQNGGPTAATYQHIDIASDGTVYVAANNPAGGWKYTNGTWTQLALPAVANGGYSAVAVSPTNSALVFFFAFGGNPYRSQDAGQTWQEITAFLGTGADIPWFDTVEKGWISVGTVVFDPTVENRLWIAEGMGVWRSTDLFDDQLTWQSVSRGIEQLVSNDVTAPPGGKPVTAHWDFGVFYHDNLDVFPTRNGTNGRFNSAWDVDYSAGTPSFLAITISDHRFCCYWDGLVNQSGYSTDGGQSWTRVASLVNGTHPEGLEFGAIAVATNDTRNLVWVPTFNATPHYTLDGGATWNPISLPGTTDPGSHQQYYLNRRIVTPDRVLPNTFYLYHPENAIYRTTNGGATWEQMPSTNLPKGWAVGYFNAILQAVPGQAGHLFWTSGPLDGQTFSFYRSTDGGASWSEVNGVQEVMSFGYGKAATEGGYPAIYLQGIVNGEPGIWRSVDGSASWQKIATYPLGIYDTIKSIDGDKDVFGRVYLGIGGSGFVYGETSEQVVIPTPVATETVAPTEPSPTTTLLPTVTTIPTLEPLTATPSPTVPPDQTVLQIEAPVQANLGQTVSLNLLLRNPRSVYAFQAQCSVDPAVLRGLDVIVSPSFTGESVFNLNAGYQSSGEWLVAGTLLNPAPALTSDTTLITLEYDAIAAGMSTLTCQAVAVDANGQDVPLTVIPAQVEIINLQSTATLEPTVMPVTATPLPPTVTREAPTLTSVPPTDVPPPTATLTLPTSVPPTLTPAPTGQPLLAAIAGTVRYEARQNHEGILLTLIQGTDGFIVAQEPTDTQGRFAIGNLQPGTYTLTGGASGHLGLRYTFTVTAGEDAAIAVILSAGDTDNNTMIDLADAGLIGANFLLSAPPAPATADLNGDGTINIFDLVLVGKNFGRSGPIQPSN
jgi:photosystem II stability/assembly factor-like uncharacterized protein